jgi:hypothetical protein
VKTKVTLTLDPATWENFRIQAIREKTSGSAIIDRLMAEYISERGGKRSPDTPGDEGEGLGRRRNLRQRRGKQQNAGNDPKR